MNNKAYLNNMMISQHSRKIAISFMIVLGLSLAMITYDLSRMRIMQSKLDVITKEHNVKTSLMTTFQHGIYERQISLRHILLMEDPFDRDLGKTEFNSYAVNIVEARSDFLRLPLNEKEKILITEISTAMVVAYKAQLDLIDASIYEGKVKFSRNEIDHAFKTQAVVLDMVKQMIMLQQQATKKSVMDAEQSYQEAKTSIYVLGGSSLIFGLLVAFLIIRLTESQAGDVNDAMAELEKSRNELENRVNKRTEQLAQARDVALASNKSKDNFLATMSHELRTPLNIIIGYSEMLEEQAIDENVKSFIPDLKKIQTSAHHQLKLVSSILDISKIEEGRLEIYPVDFDIEKLVSEIEEAARPLIAKNDNVFEVKCIPGIGMMYSDNMRIHQILLNLLSNAAKFTHEGIISLNVTKDNDGDLITFEVQDSGVGISESYMNELFEKFTQADSSTTRKYGGSGLGLSISKQLSKQLNGDITVTSEKHKGSKFTLTLPVIYIE